MPKNIYSIKENYKKSEEVREIKSEIPTYEEFLKNCNQEQVNYEDLTHEDISSNKGYGPCHYSNVDCTCYTSQGFIQLYIPCPAIGCSNRYSASTWLHSKNGYLMTAGRSDDVCGVLLVSNQGQIRCVNCGVASHFSNWSFNCHDYRHGEGHKKTDAANFSNALTLTGGAMRNRSFAIKNVVRDLSNYLWDC
jgi:hypothetical protein